MRKQLNKSLLICILVCVQDAMGRWYCCNDSFVSVSTLQEVLSEKVYILFFSRTNQRPASASTALASNGIRSRDCNGSEHLKAQRLLSQQNQCIQKHLSINLFRRRSQPYLKVLKYLLAHG